MCPAEFLMYVLIVLDIMTLPSEGGFCRVTVRDGKLVSDGDCENPLQSNVLQELDEKARREKICRAANNPCINGGTCSKTDLRPYYECNCREGHFGQNCSEGYCSAHPNPCRNGGICGSAITSPFFTCQCAGGFYGDTCGHGYCSAHPNPCRNGGICGTAVTSPFFTCQCAGGFYGNTCEDQYCFTHTNPCINGGVCSSTLTSPYFTCQCSYGFYGNTCHLGPCTHLLYDNKCFTPVTDREVDYSGAVSYCRSSGSRLANIYSQSHMETLMTYIRGRGMISGSTWKQFRLGLKFDPLENKLTLRDGITEADALQWHNNHPVIGSSNADRTNVMLEIDPDASSTAHRYLVNELSTTQRYIICEAT